MARLLSMFDLLRNSNQDMQKKAKTSLKSKTSTLKGKEVLLVCKSGGRAGMAKSILKKEGIIAHNLGPWQKVQNL